jgi:hypothetical protein
MVDLTGGPFVPSYLHPHLILILGVRVGRDAEQGSLVESILALLTILYRIVCSARFLLQGNTTYEVVDTVICSSFNRSIFKPLPSYARMMYEFKGIMGSLLPPSEILYVACTVASDDSRILHLLFYSYEVHVSSHQSTSFGKVVRRIAGPEDKPHGLTMIR